MKYFLALFILFGIGSIISCGDEDHDTEEFDYDITIMQPNTDDKQAGDTIHIHVNFDELSAKTVHHINVTIKNAADGTVLYSKPDVAHVHAESGHHEHHDDFVLDVPSNTDLILEAKVWGHEDGVAEKIKSIQFQVL